MTLAQLEAFSAVAARGSFTLAAAQLGISQSGVSHAIRSLEEELDVELLHRHPGHIELTDIGMSLLQRAQTILGVSETMRQEALDARGMKQGTLRIGSFGPSSSMHVLPPILDAYARAYPGIAVHVDEGRDRDVIQWLLDRRIDVGFVVSPDDRFDLFPIMEDQMVAALPSNHPLTSKSSVTLKDLSAYPFALTQAGSADMIMRLFISAKVQPDIRYRMTQLVSTLDIVTRGHGVAIAAEAALLTVKKKAFAIRPLSPAVKRSVALAVVDHSQSSPATKVLIQLAQRMQSKTVSR